MKKLPVIIGMGGINCAGRTSANRALMRILYDDLKIDHKNKLNQSLAKLMNLSSKAKLEQQILNNTMIRKLSKDKQILPTSKTLHSNDAQLVIKQENMPKIIPNNWQINSTENNKVYIKIKDGNIATNYSKPLKINIAGQLPTGFMPNQLYPSKNHPRSIQMTIFALNDAIASSGLDIIDLAQNMHYSELSVHATSSQCLSDINGIGGMFNAKYLGKKITSKQFPMSYPQMIADFTNSYLLGNYGNTLSGLGACASLLYNLKLGINDIINHNKKLSIIGNSDAPIEPEILESFDVINALVRESDSNELFGQNAKESLISKLSRPFAKNAGFVMSESAQFFILADLDYALEIGAEIYGSVADVMINSDGYKKSITAPGVGNYLSFATATKKLSEIIGEKNLDKSYVQAHGTSTYLNRITESDILNKTAKAFNIKSWDIVAIKCYLGHSQGSASGDQLAIALNSWQFGIIPKITIDKIADDVQASNLNFLLENISAHEKQASLLNAKGFGGNNATAIILSPAWTYQIVKQKLTNNDYKNYQNKLLKTKNKINEQEVEYDKGNFNLKYYYDHNVVEHEKVKVTKDQIHFGNKIFKI